MDSTSQCAFGEDPLTCANFFKYLYTKPVPDQNRKVVTNNYVPWITSSLVEEFDLKLVMMISLFFA